MPKPLSPAARKRLFAALLGLAHFLPLSACSAAPPPAVSLANELSPACLQATAALPAACSTSLGIACANVEGSGWLKPDYACLARSASCAEAKACPVVDARP